jgi:hypothetical protein
VAKVTYSSKLNTQQIRMLLQSSHGAVAKDIIKRCIRVESKAKQNISKNPKRVDTGRLRASITWEIRLLGQKPVGRVGTNVKYAKFVHDGTGIYGPTGQLIRPKHAKALRWKSKQYGAKKGKGKGYAFAQYVKGMKPNPFLKDALSAAKY